ncbi:MAG: hypothetical protein OXH32_03785 [Acidobacteria bacterium]|nr:hypothetical protein [Acidobacteriota bacterium]
MALKAPHVPHLNGRDAALRELGFRPYEAAWLALVCLHSGVFTRTQFIDYMSTSAENARLFLGRLVDAGVAREHPLPDHDTRLRYTHVFARRLYRALGDDIEHIRHRKKPETPKEDDLLFRRLLSLDHVLQHPDLPWLATEQEKVDHFTGRGIRRDLLPKRRYGRAPKRTLRYFAPLKLPIAADHKSATFVYVDPGLKTDSELQKWSAQHRALWARLRELGTKVRVATVSRTVAKQGELSRKVAAWTDSTPSAGQPLTPEERETLAAVTAAIHSADPDVLEPWGGFQAARRVFLPLRQRADAEESGVPSGPLIDGFSTHHARGLAPQALA